MLSGDVVDWLCDIKLSCIYFFLFQNVIPFVLVTCAFRAIHITTHVPIRALFLLVLIMTDVMALVS